MRALRSIGIFFRNLDLVIGGTCLALLIILTTIGVVARYGLNRPLAWMEEVQMLLFIWMSFFGSSLAFRYGNHIAIEVVVEMFPVRGQKIINVINTILVLAVLGLMMYFECRRGQSLLRSGRATGILQIPQALNYFGVAAACLFMMINLTVQRGKVFLGWMRSDCMEGAYNE